MRLTVHASPADTIAPSPPPAPVLRKTDANRRRPLPGLTPCTPRRPSVRASRNRPASYNGGGKMQTQSRYWSRLGLLGGIYAVLFVIANVVLNEPGSGTAGASVVKYYHDHRTTETVGVFVIAFAVVAPTFFLAP